MHYHIASVFSCKTEFLAYFVIGLDAVDLRFCIGVKANVHSAVLAVTIHIIYTPGFAVLYRSEVHALDFIFEALAFLPAYHIVVSEAFSDKFDCTLPADFQYHALVCSRNIGIAGHRACEIRIRIQIGRFHVQVRHSDSVAKLLYRLVDVALCQCSQFSLGFGKVKINFRRTEQNDVII